MNMDCEKIRVDIGAYLDGELSDSERSAVETHIASCGGCAKELEELRTLKNRVSGLPRIKAPADFLARVKQAVAAPLQMGGESRESGEIRRETAIETGAKRGGWRWASGAIGVAAVVVIGLIVYFALPPSSDKGVAGVPVAKSASDTKSGREAKSSNIIALDKMTAAEKQAVREEFENIKMPLKEEPVAQTAQSAPTEAPSPGAMRDSERKYDKDEAADKGGYSPKPPDIREKKAEYAERFAASEKKTHEEITKPVAEAKPAPDKALEGAAGEKGGFMEQPADALADRPKQSPPAPQTGAMRKIKLDEGPRTESAEDMVILTADVTAASERLGKMMAQDYKGVSSAATGEEGGGVVYEIRVPEDELDDLKGAIVAMADFERRAIALDEKKSGVENSDRGVGGGAAGAYGARSGKDGIAAKPAAAPEPAPPAEKTDNAADVRDGARRMEKKELSRTEEEIAPSAPMPVKKNSLKGETEDEEAYKAGDRERRQESNYSDAPSSAGNKKQDGKSAPAGELKGDFEKDAKAKEKPAAVPAKRPVKFVTIRVRIVKSGG
jgi:anti-sigma factor RsiW